MTFLPIQPIVLSCERAVQSIVRALYLVGCEGFLISVNYIKLDKPVVMSHNEARPMVDSPACRQAGLLYGVEIYENYRIGIKTTIGLVVTRLPCAVGMYVQNRWIYPSQFLFELFGS